MFPDTPAINSFMNWFTVHVTIGLRGMMGEWVSVAAPATISNIGAGFDVFGMALENPYDIVEGRIIESGVKITKISGPGSEGIPTDSTRNSAGISAAAVLEKSNAKFGIEIRIKKGIRPCSGIGSSGASAAGGAYLANVLTGEKLTPSEVVECAAKSEKVTSGGLHADNVAPCVVGGFTAIRSYNPLEIISVEPPANLGVAVAMPNILVPTKESRLVLPKSVSVEDAVFHFGHIATMVHAMHVGDIPLIGRSVADAVFEPARAKLVPHLKEAENAALKLGAVASFMGGSGPCVISFFDKSSVDGEAIAEGVKSVFTDNGIKCEAWVTGWGRGCEVLK